METEYIGTFAVIGVLFTALIVLALLYAIGCMTVDKIKEFGRSHERKCAMERQLEYLEGRVSKLEKDVSKLEGGE